FIEYASALLFFLCGVASLLLVPRFSGFRARAAMHLLMAVGFIAMAGEEISWGQRIFGWETSEAMRQLNVQGETNLHHLAGYFADHFFILAVFLYGFVFPVLAYQYPFFRKFFDYLGLP